MRESLPGDEIDRRDEGDTTGTDYGTGGKDAPEAGYEAGTSSPGTTTLDAGDTGSAGPTVEYHSDRPLNPGDSEYEPNPTGGTGDTTGYKDGSTGGQ